MRYSLSAVSALLLLFGCATQQVAVHQEARTTVCAVKAGEKQNYWTEEAARSAGALVILAGECPSVPSMDGSGAGSGM